MGNVTFLFKAPGVALSSIHRRRRHHLQGRFCQTHRAPSQSPLRRRTRCVLVFTQLTHLTTAALARRRTRSVSHSFAFSSCDSTDAACTHTLLVATTLLVTTHALATTAETDHPPPPVRRAPTNLLFSVSKRQERQARNVCSTRTWRRLCMLHCMLERLCETTTFTVQCTATHTLLVTMPSPQLPRQTIQCHPFAPQQQTQSLLAEGATTDTDRHRHCWLKQQTQTDTDTAG
jgi:hypothetical protein